MVENTDIHGLQLPQPSTFRNGCLALMHYIHSMTLVQAIRVARWYICLHTKNSNFGTFLKAWQRKKWYISWTFGEFHDPLGLFMFVWYIFSQFCDFLDPLGLFHGHLVYILPFWYVLWRQIWQPRKRSLSGV
jgi:hypothetical protein